MGLVGWWWGVRGQGRGSSRWRGLGERGERVVICSGQPQQRRQRLRIWQQQYQQQKQQQAVCLLRRSE
jgi:hypothetical protein